MSKTYDILVRKGKRGYVGYYGEKGNLRSARVIRSRANLARQDAINGLINRSEDQ